MPTADVPFIDCKSTPKEKFFAKDITEMILSILLALNLERAGGDAKTRAKPGKRKAQRAKREGKIL